MKLRALARRWVIPALIAGVGLQVLGQATGVNTVIYYAPTIFKHAGPGSAVAILATVGVGIVNMVMTVAGMNLVDRIGRRRLLMIGAGIQGLALVALSVTFSIGGLSAGTGVIAFICVGIYIAAACLDVVVFIIPSEIYPLGVRGTAMSVTLFANWGMNFVVSLTFLRSCRPSGPPEASGCTPPCVPYWWSSPLALSPRPGGAASRTSKSISISAPPSTSRRG